MTVPASGGIVPNRAVLILQLLTTALALGWLPGNGFKLAVMIAAWVLGFGRLTKRELLMMLVADALFTVMNGAALARGVFRFEHPDLLGMPIYEFLMWGFYILHTARFIGVEAERPRRIGLAIAFAIAFSLPFSLTADPVLLLIGSGGVLAVTIGFFHRPRDLGSAAYMVLVGAVIEYVGVSTGQWSYPHAPAGGVPLWFITMWGGVGLFSRRLFVPML